MASIVPRHQSPAMGSDLLLRETHHQFSNDLQLVVSLLALQSRRAASREVRQALSDAMERVSILARARRALHGAQHQSLEAALRQVCEALHAQAEPRSILVSFQAAHEASGLSPTEITTVALVVNELATNAIKHAFEEGQPGHVSVTAGRIGNREMCVTVSDNGKPLPETAPGADRLGLGLVRRLADSIGGLLVTPPSGSKVFELRLPAMRS